MQGVATYTGMGMAHEESNLFSLSSHVRILKLRLTYMLQPNFRLIDPFERPEFLEYLSKFTK